MANRKSKLEALGREALATVSEFANAPRVKARILSRERIESFALSKALYDAYLAAIEEFNQARLNLMTAKTKMQKGFDDSLFKAAYFSKPKHWDFKLDEFGNLRVWETDRDFERRFKRIAQRRQGQPIADDDGVSFDWIDKDTLDLEEMALEGTSDDSTSEGTSYSNLPSDLYGNEQAYLTAYRRCTNMDQKLSFYRMQLADDEWTEFFKLLRKGEQKNLYDLLNQEEQGAVSHLLK